MPIDLVGIPKVFDGDESGTRRATRKLLPMTDALLSYSRHGTPAASMRC